MSVKNRDTWEFAHKYCGKIWYVSGIVLLPLSIVSMFFVLGKNEDTTGTFGLIICIIQLIPLVGAVFPAERALKKTFDKNGDRRQQNSR